MYMYRHKNVLSCTKNLFFVQLCNVVHTRRNLLTFKQCNYTCIEILHYVYTYIE